MNAFDHAFITFFNTFAQHSLLFDALSINIIQNHLFKGGIMMVVFWWSWFAADIGNLPSFHRETGKSMDPKDKKSAKSEKGKAVTAPEKKPPAEYKISEGVEDIRSRLIAVAIGSMASLFIVRLLAMSLEFRPRPFFHPGYSRFEWPYFVTPDNLQMLNNWSSFPSDHAALFFALSFGLLFVSRIAGTLTCAYVLLVICIPRIYTGLHYPTDIIAGMIIAVLFVSLALYQPVRSFITRPFMAWLKIHPPSFYASTFLLSFLIGTIFDDLRNMFNLVWRIMN